MQKTQFHLAPWLFCSTSGMHCPDQYMEWPEQGQMQCY